MTLSKTFHPFPLAIFSAREKMKESSSALSIIYLRCEFFGPRINTYYTAVQGLE